MKDLSCRQLPSTIHRIETPVEWPPGHAALYLIERDEPVLIDAGNPGKESKSLFIDELGELGYSPGDIEHIVITHPHIDHVGQARTVFEEGDPTVYIMDGAEEFLTPDGWRERFESGFREVGVPSGLRDEAVAEMMDTFSTSRDSLPPEEIDVSLDDGGTFEVGGLEFDSLHTPGHQAYHLCLATRIEGRKVMFAGDTLAKNFRPLTFHVSFREDMYDGVGAYYTGLERLKGRSIDVVYPGHGPVFQEYSSSIRNSIQSLDRLVESSYDLLGGGLKSALDVTIERVGADPEMVRHNLLDTVGALGYLEENRDVESVLDDGVRKFRVTD